MAGTGADEQLLERWASPQGEALAEQVLSRLLAGDGLTGLDELHVYEGRTDLRFIPAGMAGRQIFEGVALTDLDLRGASLPQYRFADVAMTNCIFDDADCSGWTIWNTRVSECSFQGADLRSAVVGSWQNERRNRWTRVSFRRADLRHAVSVAALYEQCDFSLANLTGVEFHQCGLDSCRFDGRLRNVTFDGRPLLGRPEPLPMRDVDFANSVFSGVEFRGVLLDAVTLPNDPDLSVFRDFTNVARHALSALEGDNSGPARVLRAELSNRLKMAGGRREDGVVNRRDYLRGKTGSQDLAEFVLAQLTRAAEQV